MDDLIRRSDAAEVFQLGQSDWKDYEAAHAIETLPAVDAVEVVRCRECKMHGNCYAEDVFAVARLDDNKRFCGGGQRRVEEHNAAN